MKPFPNIKKIAVLRANALGDFIFALPALQALKETYPQAEIVYLGRPWHQEFLSERPSPVDRVIVIPKSPGVRDERPFDDAETLADFFEEMQKEQCDVAVQIHGGGLNSNPFLLQLGAKFTIGTKTPDAAVLDRWIPYVYYHSEILRYLEVVKLIGATTDQIEPTITVTERDIQEARQALGNDHKPYVIIHPGATDLRRQWNPNRFAQVGDFVAEKGYRVLITGIDSEQELVNTVLSAMHMKGESFCNKVSLSGLTGLIASATLLVSNDTGPLHLAEAVNTPTIGLYWCGNLINGGPMTRTIHRPHISWTITCPLCHENCSRFYPFDRRNTTCQHDVPFINDISVDEVIFSVQDLLQGKYQKYRSIPTTYHTIKRQPSVM